MKILAETTGSFLLTDPASQEVAQAHRPSVITISSFFHARIAIGQITKLADIPDEATDADFDSYWGQASDDKELAVASFLSQFSGSAPTKPAAKRGK